MDADHPDESGRQNVLVAEAVDSDFSAELLHALLNLSSANSA